MLPPPLKTETKKHKNNNLKIIRRIKRSTPQGKLKHKEEIRLIRLNRTAEQKEQHAIVNRKYSATINREKDKASYTKLLKRKRLENKRSAKKRREEKNANKEKEKQTSESNE